MADHISSGSLLVMGSGCAVDIIFSRIHLGRRTEDDTVIGCLLGLVVCSFFLSWSRCPFTVVSLWGRCLLISFLVRPGSDASKSLSMTARSIYLADDPSVA